MAISAKPEGMKRWLAAIHRLEDAVLALLLSVMILLASAQIILRNLFDTGIAWGDPLLRVMVLWLGLLGALAASRKNKHISIDVLPRILSQRGKKGVAVITSLFTAAVCAIVAWHAARFVALDYEARSIAFAGVPAWVAEIIIPFAFGLIALRYLLLMLVDSWNLISPQPHKGTENPRAASKT